MEHTSEELLSTSDAARLIGISADTLRYHEGLGRLKSIRTSRGIRLFRRGDVDAFVAARGHARGANQQADVA